MWRSETKRMEALSWQFSGNLRKYCTKVLVICPSLLQFLCPAPWCQALWAVCGGVSFCWPLPSQESGTCLCNWELPDAQSCSRLGSGRRRCWVHAGEKWLALITPVGFFLSFFFLANFTSHDFSPLPAQLFLKHSHLSQPWQEHFPMSLLLS